MIDALGRSIHYLRVSVTDRCNLRCRYCMPNGVAPLRHEDILTYEEMLRICRIAMRLGIDRFKVTGGEPLARKGCVDFIERLKGLEGVKQVTLTTNGVLLPEALDRLAALPIDGVNISLDTLDPALYRRVTGIDGDALSLVLKSLERSVSLGIRTKVNAVLLEETFDALPGVLALTRRYPVDIRLIELMPLGEGVQMKGVSSARAMELLKRLYPDLRPLAGERGNGPARYFAASGLMGAVGLIDAVSHRFCESCNRARLTSTGLLKPCLCYGTGVELKPLLRGQGDDTELESAMRRCLWNKPASHCFGDPAGVTERSAMNRIGG